MWSQIRKTAKILTLIWVLSLITFATYMVFIDIASVGNAVAAALSTVVGIFSYVSKLLVDSCDKEQ